MSGHYYIKRNGKTQGPISSKRLKDLVKTKKIKASDEISASFSGPWEKFSKVYKSVLGNDERTRSNSQKVKSDSTVSRQEGNFLQAIDDYGMDGPTVSSDEYLAPRFKERKAKQASREAAIKAAQEEEKGYIKERNKQILTYAAWGGGLLTAAGGLVFLLFIMGDLFVETANHHTTEAFEGLEKILEAKKQEKVKSQSEKQNKLNGTDLDISALSGTYEIGDFVLANAAHQTLRLEHAVESQQSGFNSAQQALEVVELFLSKGFVRCDLKVTQPNSNELQCSIKTIQKMVPEPNSLTSESRKELLKVKQLLKGKILVVNLNLDGYSTESDIKNALKEKLANMRVANIK